MTTVPVPPERLERWVDNFTGRHGATSLGVVEGCLTGAAEDGSRFRARLPFGREYDGPPHVPAFAEACAPPAEWGILLVRKGGFAVARLRGSEVVTSKVGRRHVQGRSKAGGWSQQRFARRRDQQTRVAFEAAAEHARRILAGVGLVVAGGDRAAVDAVLTDPVLTRLEIVSPFLSVPDPRREVLDRATRDAASSHVEVTDTQR